MTLRVTDSGNPALSATQTITITTTEVNQAPTLTTIEDKTVAEGAPLVFTVTASDPDLPSDRLRYALLVGAPDGATIDPETGIFKWTPAEQHGPGSFTIGVSATDSGTPALEDTTSFTVHVTETNEPPVVVAIDEKQALEHEELTFRVSANDPDVPATTLSYFLEPGAPLGATIDPASGVFRWTPGELDGPKDHVVAVRVSDSGLPELNTIETFTVHVDEVNRAPQLDPIDNMMSLPGAPATFTATASDPDAPAQLLSFSLGAGSPSGASIDPTTGVFQWNPGAGQAGIHLIEVVVSDDGPNPLTDSRSFFVQAMSLNPLGGFDWGQIDHIDVPGQEALGQDRYRFRADRTGLVSLEALF